MDQNWLGLEELNSFQDRQTLIVCVATIGIFDS
jgi:hypothetical protein